MGNFFRLILPVTVLLLFSAALPVLSDDAFISNSDVGLAQVVGSGQGGLFQRDSTLFDSVAEQRGDERLDSLTGGGMGTGGNLGTDVIGGGGLGLDQGSNTNVIVIPPFQGPTGGISTGGTGTGGAGTTGGQSTYVDVDVISANPAGSTREGGSRASQTVWNAGGQTNIVAGSSGTTCAGRCARESSNDLAAFNACFNSCGQAAGFLSAGPSGAVASAQTVVVAPTQQEFNALQATLTNAGLGSVANSTVQAGFVNFKTTYVTIVENDLPGVGPQTLVNLNDISPDNSLAVSADAVPVFVQANSPVISRSEISAAIAGGASVNTVDIAQLATHLVNPISDTLPGGAIQSPNRSLVTVVLQGIGEVIADVLNFFGVGKEETTPSTTSGEGGSSIVTGGGECTVNVCAGECFIEGTDANGAATITAGTCVPGTDTISVSKVCTAFDTKGNCIEFAESGETGIVIQVEESTPTCTCSAGAPPPGPTGGPQCPAPKTEYKKYEGDATASFTTTITLSANRNYQQLECVDTTNPADPTNPDFCPSGQYREVNRSDQGPYSPPARYVQDAPPPPSNESPEEREAREAEEKEKGNTGPVRQRTDEEMREALMNQIEDALENPTAENQEAAAGWNAAVAKALEEVLNELNAGAKPTCDLNCDPEAVCGKCGMAESIFSDSFTDSGVKIEILDSTTAGGNSAGSAPSGSQIAAGLKNVTIKISEDFKQETVKQFDKACGGANTTADFPTHQPAGGSSDGSGGGGGGGGQQPPAGPEKENPTMPPPPPPEDEDKDDDKKNDDRSWWEKLWDWLTGKDEPNKPPAGGGAPAKPDEPPKGPSPTDPVPKDEEPPPPPEQPAPPTKPDEKPKADEPPTGKPPASNTPNTCADLEAPKCGSGICYGQDGKPDPTKKCSGETGTCGCVPVEPKEEELKEQETSTRTVPALNNCVMTDAAMGIFNIEGQVFAVTDKNGKRTGEMRPIPFWKNPVDGKTYDMTKVNDLAAANDPNALKVKSDWKAAYAGVCTGNTCTASKTQCKVDPIKGCYCPDKESITVEPPKKEPPKEEPKTGETALACEKSAAPSCGGKCGEGKCGLVYFAQCSGYDKRSGYTKAEWEKAQADENARQFAAGNAGKNGFKNQKGNDGKPIQWPKALNDPDETCPFVPVPAKTCTCNNDNGPIIQDTVTVVKPPKEPPKETPTTPVPKPQACAVNEKKLEAVEAETNQYLKDFFEGKLSATPTVETWRPTESGMSGNELIDAIQLASGKKAPVYASGEGVCGTTCVANGAAGTCNIKVNIAGEDGSGKFTATLACGCGNATDGGFTYADPQPPIPKEGLPAPEGTKCGELGASQCKYGTCPTGQICKSAARGQTTGAAGCGCVQNSCTARTSIPYGLGAEVVEDTRTRAPRDVQSLYSPGGNSTAYAQGGVSKMCEIAKGIASQQCTANAQAANQRAQQACANWCAGKDEGLCKTGSITPPSINCSGGSCGATNPGYVWCGRGGRGEFMDARGNIKPDAPPKSYSVCPAQYDLVDVRASISTGAPATVQCVCR